MKQNEKQDGAEREPEFDQSVIDQLVREGKDNIITTYFVDRPICVLTSGIIILIIVSMISISLGYFSLSD